MVLMVKVLKTKISDRTAHCQYDHIGFFDVPLCCYGSVVMRVLLVLHCLASTIIIINIVYYPYLDYANPQCWLFVYKMKNLVSEKVQDFNVEQSPQFQISWNNNWTQRHIKQADQGSGSVSAVRSEAQINTSTQLTSTYSLFYFTNKI